MLQRPVDDPVQDPAKVDDHLSAAWDIRARYLTLPRWIVPSACLFVGSMVNLAASSGLHEAVKTRVDWMMGCDGPLPQIPVWVPFTAEVSLVLVVMGMFWSIVRVVQGDYNQATIANLAMSIVVAYMFGANSHLFWETISGSNTFSCLRLPLTDSAP